MLCSTMKEVEREGITHFCSDETRFWWAEHQRRDAERERRERESVAGKERYQASLEKLTPETRAALGLPEPEEADGPSNPA